jgi:hypothetical protein
METYLEKRYEKRCSLPPCRLNRDDLLQLAALIQDTFSKTEVDRYFRVSTNIGDTRVFSNSLDDFLNQPNLPAKFHDLSFWMEGWQEKTRFDKAILLDFGKYSAQLSVEGIDPVWVYDRYQKIAKFLRDKRAWYWPVIALERVLILAITTILISNILISRRQLLDKFILLGLWIFLVFSDTRRVWPYSCINMKRKNPLLEKENVAIIILVTILLATLVMGTIAPLFKR